MTDSSQPDNEAPKAGSAKVTIIACVLLAAAAAGAAWVIFSTEPEAERSTETRETAMLVDVIEVEVGNYRPQISALGRVHPAREIELSPRISGEVIERSANFTPGGFIARGEPLLKIDPADYENNLLQRRSELHRAEADLKIEMGRQRVAESDLDLLDEDIPQDARGLALRQPQLDIAKAAVEAAKAAVRQAELDLERTEIVAPFDVQVIDRLIDVGSQVTPADNLGRLVGQETYWVLATVPISSLAWIERGTGDQGSTAVLRDRSAWPDGMERHGTVERLIGTLDQQTRLARLLITVEDPLARLEENQDKPSLILDSIIEAIITGKEIRNCVRLKRANLRENDTAWIMDENQKLKIVSLDIIFKDAEYAYVSSGLADGDRVVTTGLTTVSEGAALRTEGGNP